MGTLSDGFLYSTYVPACAYLYLIFAPIFAYLRLFCAYLCSRSFAPLCLRGLAAPYISISALARWLERFYKPYPPPEVSCFPPAYNVSILACIPLFPTHAKAPIPIGTGAFVRGQSSIWLYPGLQGKPHISPQPVSFLA